MALKPHVEYGAGDAGEGLKDVKIIALTANALSGDEARCLESGMNVYMTKPLGLTHSSKLYCRFAVSREGGLFTKNT